MLAPTFRANDGTQRLELTCGEGFLQALPGKVTILADAALWADEIDTTEARADLAAAQEELRAASELEAQRRAQTKIDFANARLAVKRV